jgi:hypothetical protein
LRGRKVRRSLRKGAGESLRRRKRRRDEGEETE